MHTPLIKMDTKVHHPLNKAGHKKMTQNTPPPIQPALQAAVVKDANENFREIAGSQNGSYFETKMRTPERTFDPITDSRLRSQQL